MRRTAVVLALAMASIGLAPSGADAGGAAVVTLFPFRYNPDPIEIAKGDTVTFVNMDGLSGEGHSLTHAVAAGQELFKTPIIPPTTSAPVAGVEALPAGQYPFTCRVHAFMNGILVVK